MINASEYGMPQRRRRVFIFATKSGTPFHEKLHQYTPLEILQKKGIFAETFSVKNIEENMILSKELSDDLVDITENFNKNTPKQNAFLDAGYMIDGNYYTAKVEADYSGELAKLGEFLVEEKDVPNEFYISDEELAKWQYQKGAKSIERINKTTGHKYTYSEGSMSFPDATRQAITYYYYRRRWSSA